MCQLMTKTTSDSIEVPKGMVVMDKSPDVQRRLLQASPKAQKVTARNGLVYAIDTNKKLYKLSSQGAWTKVITGFNVDRIFIDSKSNVLAQNGFNLMKRNGQRWDSLSTTQTEAVYLNFAKGFFKVLSNGGVKSWIAGKIQEV